MERMFQRNKCALLKDLVNVAACVFFAVVLPQVFHAVSVLIGAGEMLGQIFLPMYLPVLVLALKSNAVSGLVAGILSPLVSFALTGMPGSAVLPFIVIELACFGLLSGLLSKKEMNLFAKIVLVQLFSKIVRLVAVLVAVYGLEMPNAMLTALWSATVLAIPGYALQLVGAPWLLKRVLR